MKRFDEILEEKTEEFFPTPKQLSKFSEVMTRKNFTDIYLTEQEELEAPPTDAPAPEAPALEDKPYSTLGEVAYKALLINPADIQDSPYFDRLKTLTQDGRNVNDAETGVRVFQLIEKIIDDALDAFPTDESMPAASE